jgi:hypothetical protein
MRKAKVETKQRKSKLTCPNGHLTRDKAWLEEKYFGENLSIAKIAKLIPCDYGTIHKAFKRLGIAFKPKHVTYGDIAAWDRSGENNPHWKGGKHHCPDCNIELGYRYSKNGLQTRCDACSSKFYRGERHHSWLPPELRKVTESEQIRQSAEYKDWRLSVWVRDKTKCQICGIRKDPMVAHHLDGFNAFPEKRFDVDNGVTLCDFHHISFHSNYGFGNNTKEQFEKFKSETTEMTY